MNRLCKKKYPDSAYEWVKERAEHLQDKADIDEAEAYGISWKQYKKEKGKSKSKSKSRLKKKK
jgi:hypothetical protein